MEKSRLRNTVSLAIIVGGLLSAGMAWQAADGQTASSALWSTSSNQLVLQSGLGQIDTGTHVQVPLPGGGQADLVISQNDRLYLGARKIVAASEDGSASLTMVTQNGAAFGTLVANGKTYSLTSDALAASSIVGASDLSQLSARLSEATLVQKSAIVSDPQASRVIAWISPEFSQEWGLASAARTQFLVEEINAARAQNGLKAVELVATRPVETSTDPVFAASGISISAADTIFADTDLALVASVLPSSRSVRTGVAATAYATIINPGSSDATDCGLVMSGTGPDGTFHFQETDAQNQPTGTQDAFVTIPGSAAQSYVFSFASTSAQSPGLDLPIEFTCSNRISAPVISGLNTLFFSASDTDVPDIVAISETGSAVGLNTDPGVVDMLDREADGAFVVAAVNVGVAGDLVVSATSTAPANFPVTLTVCQTDPSDGTCLAPPAAETTVSIGAGETPSFAVFAHSDSVLAYDPANNRVNVVFREDGNIRGSTSVALRTLLGEPDLPATMVDYAGIIANLPAHFTGAANGPNPANDDNTPVDNPVTNAGATLGRVLFYDKRLSANNTISCSSCHIQALGFTDDEVLSTGFEGGHTGRHSMRLANARYYNNGRFFWDERAATLEDQTLMPIQDSVEMGMTLEELVPKLQAVSFYPALFQAAYGDDAVTSDRISKALAQFVRSIVSTNSKFDQAFYNGTPANPDFNGTFTQQENRGRQIFGGGNGGAGCNRCHTATTHHGDAARNNGLDLTNDADEGAGNGRFKPPSLRNIGVTGPYMHDGRFSTLAEVVEFYNSGVQNNPNLDNRLRGNNGQPIRLNLSDADKAALVAFLETLDDDTLISDERYSDPFEKR